MASFNELAAALKTELKTLETDTPEHGLGLKLDNGLIVNVEEFPENEMVHLHCDLGTVPLEIRPLVLMSLMAAHTCGLATQGCFFGFEPRRESLILFRSLTLRGLPPALFIELARHFVQQVDHWSRALPELYAEAGRSAAENPAAGQTEAGLRI